MVDVDEADCFGVFGHDDAAFGGPEGAELAISGTFEDEREAAVHAAGFALGAVEILGEDQVGEAIAIDVGGGGAEGGGDLGEGGQWGEGEAWWFSGGGGRVIPPDAGFEGVGGQAEGIFQFFLGINAFERGRGEVVKEREFLAERGNGALRTTFPSDGEQGFIGQGFGFDDLPVAGSFEVCVVKTSGAAGLRMVFCIEAKVGGEDVGATVAVHIGESEAVPPSEALAEATGGGR